DQVVGINVRDDLLGSLDTLMMQYSSPSEGIFSLGQVTLIKVRDQKKLQEALNKVAQSLGAMPGVPLTVKKRNYRSVELREIQIQAPGVGIYAPTFGIHNNWLVFSLYPQPVHGFILRSTKQLLAWAPGERLKDNLQK